LLIRQGDLPPDRLGWHGDVMNDHRFDVIVIGGGAAGLGAALTLARARRSVLVLDAGEPRNATADGVHGFLSRDGIPPTDLTKLGAAEVTGYGGTIEHTRVTAARRDGDGFVVVTEDGRERAGRRLLLATGLVDELPDVPGLRQRWGRDVVHCPYCHGWEMRDRAIGMLATGPNAVRHALLWRQWSPDLTLLRHTAPPLTEEQAEQLAAVDIPVVDGTVVALEVVDDRLTGVRLASGEVVRREVLAVTPWFVARAELAAGLGLSAADGPYGSYLPADPTGLAAPGVWVAGNTTDVTAQVMAAAASGVTAARAINVDLVVEDTERAVRRRSESSQVTTGATTGASRQRGSIAASGSERGADRARRRAIQQG
jgi:thioredoxin reductase